MASLRVVRVKRAYSPTRRSSLATPLTMVSIIGIGKTAVKEHWSASIRHLAWYAIEAALDDAHTTAVDALYVGNVLAGELSGQAHLGALIADFAGMRGIEAVTVEASEASGGAALRQAVMAVESGMVQTALVVGVEKMTDKTGRDVTAAVASQLDADYEAVHGLTIAGAAALMMRRYLHEYGVSVADFAGFSVNAHQNGATNPDAMFRNRVTAARFAAAPPIADPVTVFDAAPYGDGAAALIITSRERALDRSQHPILVAGSAMATDTLSLHDRRDMLWLSAAERSAKAAMAAANVTPSDIDLFELHDNFTIMAALSLEAAGFAERGRGWAMANAAETGRDGRVPISTFGGLKARGNPIGATGVYQLVEAAQQVRGTAGGCQVAGAKVAMAQCVGSGGGTAVTHILRLDE